MSNGVPNFPTPPTKNLDALSMPNDLVANRRNYYTEMFFTDFRSAAYGGGNIINQTFDNPVGVGGAVTTAAGAGLGALLGASRGVVGAVVGGLAGGAVGAGAIGLLSATGGTQVSALSSIKLPIPSRINDLQTLSWTPMSITGTVLSAVQGVGGALTPGASQAIAAARQAGGIATGLVGKTLNPLLFMTFNQQNFREFTFEWVLAPKNKKESETILKIVNALKGASLPSFGFPFQDYPLIVNMKMYPNDLNGHVIFKPMAIEGIGVNYTANPNPSFFEDTGAPTIVTLTVRFKEIKLWYRNQLNGLPY